MNTLSEPDRASALEKLIAGRLIAKRRAPYFRSLLLSFVLREAPGLGSVAATSKRIFLYDLAFLSELTPEEAGGLWLHECLHVLNDHAGRVGARDLAIYNWAGDIAINPAIREMGATLPGGKNEGMFPATFHLGPAGRMCGVTGPLPDGLTADEYYDLLTRNPPPPPPAPGAGSKGESDDAGTPEDGNGDGDPSDGDPSDGDPSGGQEGYPGERPHAAGGWCGSCSGRATSGEPDSTDPEGRGEGEMARSLREVAEEIQARASSRGIGSIPSSLRRWAEEALRPPVIPWRTKLAQITRRAVAWRPGAVDQRYDGPSRRQAGLGYGFGKPLLPRFRTPVPRVALVVDTSGSMGSKEIADCLTEAQGILAAVGADIEFVACDAAVHELRPVANIRTMLTLLKGGGGTDFRPAFKALATRRPRPEVIIYATDGYGPAPEVPPHGMRVVWLLVGGNDRAPAPWGDVIVVED